MTTFLFIAAAVSFICGIITGFLSGSAATFAVSVISSAVLSALLIAVAQILENQGEIKEQLTELKMLTRQPPEKITCNRCGKEYLSDRTSCPFCGEKTPKTV